MGRVAVFWFLDQNLRGLEVTFHPNKMSILKANNSQITQIQQITVSQTGQTDK